MPEPVRLLPSNQIPSLPIPLFGLYFTIVPHFWPGLNPRPDREAFRVKAIISDIHSNLEALQAVLKDIEKHSVTDIYCLGDVVGYGPNPRECVDLVMKCKIVLLGNHD